MACSDVFRPWHAVPKPSSLHLINPPTPTQTRNSQCPAAVVRPHHLSKAPSLASSQTVYTFWQVVCFTISLSLGGAKGGRRRAAMRSLTVSREDGHSLCWTGEGSRIVLETQGSGTRRGKHTCNHTHTHTHTQALAVNLAQASPALLLNSESLGFLGRDRRVQNRKIGRESFTENAQHTRMRAAHRGLTTKSYSYVLPRCPTPGFPRAVRSKRHNGRCQGTLGPESGARAGSSKVQAGTPGPGPRTPGAGPLTPKPCSQAPTGQGLGFQESRLRQGPRGGKKTMAHRGFAFVTPGVPPTPDLEDPF